MDQKSGRTSVLRRTAGLRTAGGSLLGALVFVLVGASIYVWALAESSGSATTRSAATLGLFSLAGMLGGALRSFGYLLAAASFSARELKQWRLEAVVAPLLGSVTGLAAFLVVRASIVESGAVNLAGQYVLSLATGTATLTLFGRMAERGLLRAGTSRSGILGGESSAAVPLLQRIDKMLEQRVADLTIVNYDGYAVIDHRRIGRDQWLVELTFMDVDTYHDSRPGGSGYHASRLKVAGGTDHDVVPFTISALSDRLSTTPAMLTFSAPRTGHSEMANLILQRIPDLSLAGDADEHVVVVEIGQGTQVVQVVPLRIGFAS